MEEVAIVRPNDDIQRKSSSFYCRLVSWAMKSFPFVLFSANRKQNNSATFSYASLELWSHY